MKHHTKDELLTILKTYYQTHHRSPSCKDIYESASIKRQFGSWNNALQIANLPINYKSPQKSILVPCVYCKKDILKKPSQLRIYKNSFCSVSCSVSFNNKINKTKFLLCQKCNKNSPKSKTSKYCTDCYPKRIFIKDINNQTLEDLIYIKRPEAKYAIVRGRARTQYKNELKNGCQNCKYIKHVEVCHIIPISDFPINTKIIDINHKDNILLLCRNCHWEYDHQMLFLKDIPYDIDGAARET